MPALSWPRLLDLLERILPWGCLLGLFFCAILPVSHTLLTTLIIVSIASSVWPLGERLAPGMPPFFRPFAGLLSLLAAQSILQTLWYYAGGILGPRSDGLSLALPLFGFFLWQTLRPPRSTEEPSLVSTSWWEEARWFIPLLLMGEALLGFILLSGHQASVSRAINSPWPLLPAGVLAALFLLVLSLLIAIRKIQHPLVPALLTSTTLLCVSALTPLIYEIGFGFDGFLHRASESVLFQTGTLTPHPPYYIGQYVFVTWLSRLSGIGLGTIDRWLLPVLSTLLPFFFLRRDSEPRNERSSFIFLIAFLPLSILSTTTPQSVAYILGFGALILSWKQTAPLVAFLLASWSVVTHPLAGLPLAALSTGLWWRDFCHARLSNTRFALWLRYVGLSLAALLAAIGVPFAFVIHSRISSYHIDWRTERLLEADTWQQIRELVFALPVSHLALWPDWADTTTWLLGLLCLLGVIFAFISGRNERETLGFLTVGSIGLFLAGIVLAQTGDFQFLIDYERGNYAERLFLLGLLALLPVVLSGWNRLWKRVEQMPPLLITFWMVFFGIFIAGRVYHALPRHDAGVIGHGWSVGASDIEAVRFIDKDAEGKPYTVLANQSVSAAAVSQLGFKRYANDVFFYPIPTGGPLYTLFLEATATPSLSPIQAAAELGQSTRVYLVLNSYWWKAEEVKEKLIGIADRAWSVRNGEATIFQFNVTSTSAKR